MSNPSSLIATLTQRLADIQRRFAEVDSERSALQREMQSVQEQLAAALPPPYGSTNRSQVLWVLRRDPQRAYSPLDICGIMGRTREADLNSVRLLLGRLIREGVVKRIAHGRYQIV